MSLSKHRIRIEFTHEGHHFKMVDEWSNGTGLYIDGKEIGRNRQFLVIPFLQTVRCKGTFTKKNGEKIRVEVATPQIPFTATRVYFNNMEVYSKVESGL